MFLDRLFEGCVLGLKSFADCEQPRPSAQDGIIIRAFTGVRSSRCAFSFPSTTLPLFLKSSAKLQRINRHVGLGPGSPRFSTWWCCASRVAQVPSSTHAQANRVPAANKLRIVLGPTHMTFVYFAPTQHLANVPFSKCAAPLHPIARRDLVSKISCLRDDSPALCTKHSSSLIDGGGGIDDRGLPVSAGSPDECFSFFFSIMNGFPVD